ncbi:hypothetical protein FKB34_01735 [Glycocaulis profundi]|nr:hypothetical protein FKB34_01735 [Glycocaulis profundi]
MIPPARRLTAAQVAGFKVVLGAIAVAGLKPEPAAYVLATAWHETGGRMEPVREAFAATDQAAIDALERAWQAGRLGQVSTTYWRPDADGKAWFGRGYVQLTWRENYARMGERLGVDLLGDPSLAMEPRISARILVTGMVEGLFARGQTLGRYFTDLYADPVNARRIVNGTDRAQLIAGLWAEFLEAIEAGEAAR